MALHVEDFGAAVAAEQVAAVVAHGAPVLVGVVLAAPAVARPSRRLSPVAAPVCERSAVRVAACRRRWRRRGVAATAVQSGAGRLGLRLRFDLLAQNLESILG